MSSSKRIVICGAGAVGASVAYYLSLRGAAPVLVDRCRPGAAASGKAGGFLALDWNAGTPLDGLARASFALHREIANDLGAERVGYRPMQTLMVAGADEGSVEQYERVARPAWLDGNVAVHEVIGTAETTAQVDPLAFTEALVEAAITRGATFVTGVVDGLMRGDEGTVTGVTVDGQPRPADVVVLALGPWTNRAQRWLALPQVLGMKGASITLAADVPAQAVFGEFFAHDGKRSSPEIYPRAGGVVYINGFPEHDPLPDDPDEVTPSDRACDELHRIAGVHSSVLRDAEVLSRRACYRPVTIDGVPLIGPIPEAPGAFLATGHASWGILNAPATGRMITEMILDGDSNSVDATPFAVSRLPAGRM